MEWTVARARLCARHHIAIDEPELIGLACTFDATQQRVLVYPTIVDGVEYVVMMAIVASAESMSPLDALERSSRLPVGSVCLIDRSYVLRALLPLDSASEAALDRTVVTLARAAHQMRGEVTRLVVAAPYYE